LLVKEYTTWNSSARAAGLRPLPQFKLAAQDSIGAKIEKVNPNLDSNSHITPAKKLNRPVWISHPSIA
jgi:hypothetical protein